MCVETSSSTPTRTRRATGSSTRRTPPRCTRTSRAAAASTGSPSSSGSSTCCASTSRAPSSRWRTSTRPSSFFAAHGEPFNRAAWAHLVERHGGRLPIRIRAVAEGRVVPTHNILMSAESTDPELFWLVSWLETILVRALVPDHRGDAELLHKKDILDALTTSATTRSPSSRSSCTTSAHAASRRASRRASAAWRTS